MTSVHLSCRQSDEYMRPLQVCAEDGSPLPLDAQLHRLLQSSLFCSVCFLLVLGRRVCGESTLPVVTVLVHAQHFISGGLKACKKPRIWAKS